ncbi:unnamed protein product [Arctia plantaginis]|uniref:Uncharacterized protein n=1 Tax=Arctia plantaginis TaxID=874455 RepID=A0A8S1AA05_ARCPL|nr:unnamed protein product [Arctia plantaginis]
MKSIVFMISTENDMVHLHPSQYHEGDNLKCYHHHLMNHRLRVILQYNRECPADSSTSLSRFPTPSCESNFRFDELCFLCEKNWDRSHEPGIIVQDNSLKDRIVAIAAERKNDFGEIIPRLQTTRSLTDLKARYPTACFKSFMAPYCKKKMIRNLIRYVIIIENRGEFKFQLSSLKSLMSEDNNSKIEKRTLLRHLKKKYGGDIFIFRKQGKETLIYYKYYEFAKNCSDWYGKSEDLSEMAKKTIISMCQYD